MEPKGEVTPLAAPSRELAVNSVSVAPPDQAELVLHGVSFTLTAGLALGIIGGERFGKIVARALLWAYGAPA